jgi:hypothetical protein
VIEVEITAPFEGFRTGLEMATFSPSRSPQGFRGPEGISSGEALLRQLYRLCTFMEKNRKRLRDAYREYRSLAAEEERGGRLSDELFSMFKAGLDDDFKSGSIDKREYRKRLLSMREEHSRYHERKHLLVQEFFRMHFPYNVPHDLRGQVLEYLRRDFLGSGDSGDPPRVN